MSTLMNIANPFLARALETPDDEAIAFADRCLSYAQLQQLAMQVSALITCETDGPFCGIFAHRSESAYAGVLAILAAGCAYVPLNPAFPAQRNGYIAEKSGITTIVVGPECVVALREFLEATTGRFRLLSLSASGELQALAQEFAERVVWQYVSPHLTRHQAVQVDPNSPAYVLFTSGSTGQPKGVVVRHRNVARYVESLLTLYPISSQDRLSQTFDLTFDLSVHDMFVTWSAGATLVVYPPEALAEPVPYTQHQRVSVWFSVPSLAALVDNLRQAEPGSLASLRLSFFCGEKLTFNTVDFWRKLAPASRLVNLYGPTETTIALSHFEIPKGFAESSALHGAIPIGLPLPGQGLQVRRGDGSPAGIGEPGALWLFGDQLSAGYLGAPELTAQRFVERDGIAYYHTGDVVLQDSNGLLQFLGREDGQVKIMGYRVELGEIEHALIKVTGASQVMADLVTLDNDVEELMAVLPAVFSPEKKRIRRAIQDLLPHYMLPRRYFFAHEFPRNSSGKLDRRALRQQVLQAQTAE